jgi:hypothetical protein
MGIFALAADLAFPEGDIGWVPFPKQELASTLAYEADELLFGGAAGPGKTEWLMEYGIEQMRQYPGNRGLILRRVFPSLNRSIIPRLKAKLNGEARWNANEKTFTFRNGSVLECASLQYLDDVYDYQGAEYGWIGWEELTEFAAEQYEYLMTRLRAPVDGVHPHSVATTNPGGRGHTWVKRRFVKPRQDDLVEGDPMPVPTEVWRPRPIEGIHTAESPPLTRVYVPATMEDNPALIERDPGYRARVLAMADRGKRKALEEGDWDAIDEIEGALWAIADLEGGRWSPERYKNVTSLERVVSVDPSDGQDTGDGYGVCVAAKGMDGVGYLEQSHEWRAPVHVMAKRTLALYHSLGADAIVIERNHGGKWMVEVFRQLDPYANIVTVWASDGKRTRAKPVASLFGHDPDHPLPYRARLVGFHEELEEELTTTVFDGTELSPNRLDALVWAFSYLLLGSIGFDEGVVRDERLAGRR